MRALALALLALAATLAPARAEEFHASARLGAVVPFPGPVGFNPGLALEARGLGGSGFGLRVAAGLESAAVDGLYHLSGAQGPLYLGLGLGLAYSGRLEGRAVVGYAWPLTDALQAYLEAVPRLPFLGPGLPSLELAAGLSLRL